MTRSYAWDAVNKEVLNEKMWRKIISGEKAMLAQIWLAQGAAVPVHQHESEQISWVMQGALKFVLEGKEIVLRSGELLHIASNTPHQAIALEDTLALDVFSPIRRDWLAGQDNYLRHG